MTEKLLSISKNYQYKQNVRFQQEDFNTETSVLNREPFYKTYYHQPFLFNHTKKMTEYLFALYYKEILRGKKKIIALWLIKKDWFLKDW